MLDLPTLSEMVDGGEIDTVLVVFPDQQGRLVGKRVTGHYFLDHVAEGEGGIECCNYLLAVDVDMHVLPGYRFANWEQGYGDLACRPDMSTLRLIPWLEATALVVCDLFDVDSGEPIEVAPRQILRCQVERAREVGFEVMTASELEFFVFRETLRGGCGEALRGADAAERLRPRLPHPPDDEGRVPDPRDPQRHGWRGHARRVLEGRGRGRPARDQPSLRRRDHDG